MRRACANLQIGFLRGEAERPARVNGLVIRSGDRVISDEQAPVEVHHGCFFLGAAVQIAPPPARAAFRHQLISHPTERYLEVFHACRVDNGIEERFQYDQTVDRYSNG